VLERPELERPELERDAPLGLWRGGQCLQITDVTDAVPTTELIADREKFSLLQNASVLFVGQAVGLIAPLITVPYLARVLGPSGWGPVLAAQGLANWLVLVLEFGFDLSGVRAIARARPEPGLMVDTVHQIQSAKALLSLASIPVAAIVIVAIPSLRFAPTLMLWTVVFAVIRGFSPLWFFQGVERVKAPVAVDAFTRAAAALCVFAFVHGPADGWRVLALQAVFGAVSLVVLTRWLSREVTLRSPTTAAGLAALREGASIFAVRAWSGLYITGNALILSALAGPEIVAFFGGAERIVRAAINLLQPLTQVFLPRVSFLQATDPAAAERTIRRSLVGVGLIGASMTVAAIVGAPVLVKVLLGARYAAAVPVLRIMGILPLLVAVNTVLGLYWAIPFGHERVFLFSVVAAGITNIISAVLLVPRWGAAGMAVSTAAAEVFVLVFLSVRYGRRNRSRFAL
jgi:polysaccharide transporter, PST family